LRIEAGPSTIGILPSWTLLATLDAKSTRTCRRSDGDASPDGVDAKAKRQVREKTASFMTVELQCEARKCEGVAEKGPARFVISQTAELDLNGGRLGRRVDGRSV
jgi:hypothetical protein